MYQLTAKDEAQIRQAGELLCRAFLNDPAWLWIRSDLEKRRRAVWLAEPAVLRAHVPLETCWVTTEGSEDNVLAAAVWLPPGPEIGSLTYLRHGFWKLPFLVGISTFRRFLHMDKVMTAIRAEHAPAPKCWYLNTLGVSPDAQGRGLGSAIMQSVLRDVVDPSGSPATLFTSNPKNLPFYERAGFDVVHEARVGHDDGFTYWYMARVV